MHQTQFVSVNMQFFSKLADSSLEILRRKKVDKITVSHNIM